MKKFRKFLFLPLLVLLAFTLSACGNKGKQNVYQKVETSKHIVWGVRADTRLFGLTNVKSGKIEGFEMDLAKALTKQMLKKVQPALLLLLPTREFHYLRMVTWTRFWQQ